MGQVRLALYAGAPRKKLLAGRSRSNASLQVGPGYTPTPDLSPTSTLWGARGRQGQSVAALHRVFWWRSSEKARTAERPASAKSDRTP